MPLDSGRFPQKIVQKFRRTQEHSHFRCDSTEFIVLLTAFLVFHKDPISCPAIPLNFWTIFWGARMPLNFWGRFPKNSGAASWEPLTGTPTAPLWRTSLRIILFAALKKIHLARWLVDEAFPVRSLLWASSMESCYVADLAGTKPGQPAAQRYFMKSAPAGPCRFRCAQRPSLAKLSPLPHGQTYNLMQASLIWRTYSGFMLV